MKKRQLIEFCSNEKAVVIFKRFVILNTKVQLNLKISKHFVNSKIQDADATYVILWFIKVM